jgi:pantetheine-phosphate adenylyltransferase
VSLTALCPGTFDPVTNGHLDIIERAAGLFDEVVVAVVANPSKEPMFSLDERRRMLEESLESLDNVRIDSFEGLLVDYARERGVRAVVKGIRAISDFDYELQMAQMNHRLAGVETCFIPTNPIWSYLSSSLVKEVARLGGDVSGLVPDHVLTLLKERV